LLPFLAGEEFFRTCLKKYDSGREQLLPDVELVLLDAYITEEEIRQSVAA
jgi:hypothetical protein